MITLSIQMDNVQLPIHFSLDKKSQSDTWRAPSMRELKALFYAYTIIRLESYRFTGAIDTITPFRLCVDVVEMVAKHLGCEVSISNTLDQQQSGSPDISISDEWLTEIRNGIRCYSLETHVTESPTLLHITTGTDEQKTRYDSFRYERTAHARTNATIVDIRGLLLYRLLGTAVNLVRTYRSDMLRDEVRVAGLYGIDTLMFDPDVRPFFDNVNTVHPINKVSDRIIIPHKYISLAVDMAWVLLRRPFANIDHYSPYTLTDSDDWEITLVESGVPSYHLCDH